MTKRKAAKPVVLKSKYVSQAQAVCDAIAPAVMEFGQTKSKAVRAVWPIFKAAAARDKDGLYRKTIKSSPECMAVYLVLAQTFSLGANVDKDKRTSYLRNLAGRWYSHLYLHSGKRVPASIALPGILKGSGGGGDTVRISVPIPKATPESLRLALVALIRSLCSSDRLRNGDLEAAVGTLDAITGTVDTYGYMPVVNPLTAVRKAQAAAKVDAAKREPTLAATQPELTLPAAA